MRLAEGALVHQVHPAKISADVAASVISNVLLWQERPMAAMTIRCALPAAGSAAVLGLADVVAHMPPSAQAIRLAGDAMMGIGAYRRSSVLMLAGAAVVVIGWSHALWPGNSGGAITRRGDNPATP